jgi:hypothetical protein
LLCFLNSDFKNFYPKRGEEKYDPDLQRKMSRKKGNGKSPKSDDEKWQTGDERHMSGLRHGYV